MWALGDHLLNSVNSLQIETTLLERRVRGDLIEMFKIQEGEGCVSYGSDLYLAVLVGLLNCCGNICFSKTCTKM